MERSTTTLLRIGDWCVNPASGQILRNGETTRLEVRTMKLLLCLAEHAGEVVSIDDLLNQVWSGVNVTPDSVYQAVTSLRRVLGDDPKQPTYIATVPRLGYRMMAAVGAWTDGPNGGLAAGDPPVLAGSSPASSASNPAPLRRSRFVWIAAASVLLALAVVTAFRVRAKVSNSNSPALSVSAEKPEKSIAVLPFLDLTEGMKEEEFADGMTEELIDKLSKIPGLRVPAPTASFYFKGKQLPVAEIAKSLGVTYVLDGSSRKSGGRVRIAARLVRADSGYVIWTETYDHSWNDLIMIQDDIAAEVTKALKASIAGGPDHDPSH